VIAAAVGDDPPPSDSIYGGDPFMLHIYAALAEKERRMIGERTRAGLAAAKKRGVKPRGLNAKGIAEQQAARDRAEQLRPIFASLLNYQRGRRLTN